MSLGKHIAQVNMVNSLPLMDQWENVYASALAKELVHERVLTDAERQVRNLVGPSVRLIGSIDQHDQT